MEAAADGNAAEPLPQEIVNAPGIGGDMRRAGLLEKKSSKKFTILVVLTLEGGVEASARDKVRIRAWEQLANKIRTETTFGPLLQFQVVTVAEESDLVDLFAKENPNLCHICGTGNDAGDLQLASPRILFYNSFISVLSDFYKKTGLKEPRKLQCIVLGSSNSAKAQFRWNQLSNKHPDLLCSIFVQGNILDRDLTNTFFDFYRTLAMGKNYQQAAVSLAASASDHVEILVTSRVFQLPTSRPSSSDTTVKANAVSLHALTLAPTHIITESPSKASSNLTESSTFATTPSSSSNGSHSIKLPLSLSQLSNTALLTSSGAQFEDNALWGADGPFDILADFEVDEKGLRQTTLAMNDILPPPQLQSKSDGFRIARRIPAETRKMIDEEMQLKRQMIALSFADRAAVFDYYHDVQFKEVVENELDRKHELYDGRWRRHPRCPWEIPAVVQPGRVSVPWEKTIFSEIHSLFCDTKVNIIVVEGTRGSGKTSFVHQYLHLPDSPANDLPVFWFDASSEAVLLSQYLQMAGANEQMKLKLQGSNCRYAVRTVRLWFENAHSNSIWRSTLNYMKTAKVQPASSQGMPPAIRWIAVFDGAADRHSIEPFLPERGGLIIITCHKAGQSADYWRHLADCPAPCVLPVPALGRSEALQLLRVYTGEPTTRSGVWEKLCVELRDHSLCLTQAALALRHLPELLSSPADYLDLLCNVRASAARHDEVARTVELALSLLQKLSCPQTELCLRFLVWFGPSSIPVSWLHEWRSVADMVPEEHLRTWRVGPPAEHLLLQLTALGLVDLSLDGRNVSVSAVVQQAVRWRMTQAEQRRWVEIALHIVAKRWTYFLPGEQQQCQDVFMQMSDAVADVAHVEMLCMHGLQMGIATDNFAKVLAELGDLYASIGAMSQHGLVWTARLRIQEDRLGPDHAAIAWSLVQMCQPFAAKKQYGDVVRCFLKSSAIRAAIHTPEMRVTAQAKRPSIRQAFKTKLKQQFRRIRDREAIDPQAAYKSSQRRTYLEGKNVYSSVLFMLEQLLGPDDPLLASVLHQLGLIVEKQHKFADARALYERAVNILIAAKVTDDNPALLVVMERMSIVLDALGEKAEAASIRRGLPRGGLASLGLNSSNIGSPTSLLGLSSSDFDCL